MRLTKKTRLVALSLLTVFALVSLVFSLLLFGQHYAYAVTDSPYYFDEDGAVDESRGWVHVYLTPDLPSGQTKLVENQESITIKMTATNDSLFNMYCLQWFLHWDSNTFEEPQIVAHTDEFPYDDTSADANHAWANPTNDNGYQGKDISVVDLTFKIKKDSNGKSVLQSGHKYYFNFAHAATWERPSEASDHAAPMEMITENWENQMALDLDGLVAVQYHDLVLEVASANSGLSALTVGGKAPTSGFTANQSTGNQTNIVFADVPYATASVPVVATPSDSTATVVGAGTWNLNVGDNTKTVTVTHGTQSSTYTLKIKRLQNTAAQLQSLSVKAGTTELLTGANAFSSTKTTYSVTVPYATSSVNFSAAAISTATINGASSGTLNVNVGSNNKIEIEVTAQDGRTTGKYTVTITRTAASTVNTLSALSVKYGTTELLTGGQAFSAAKSEYTVTIPYKIEQLEVTASATDTLAQGVNGTGSISFPKTESTKELTITVTAENGSTKTYKVTVNRTPISSDTTLKSLSVQGQTLSPEFDPTVLRYTLTDNILPTVTSLTVNAEANFEDATVSFDPAPVSGSIPLQNGENDIRITVTAQNGESHIYFIHYNKASASTDATLASLSVEGQTLAPAFDRYTYAYTLQPVESTVESLAISAATFDEKASVVGVGFTLENGSGTFTLQDGQNEIKVEVTAENGSKQVYTIIVTRSAAVNPEAPKLDTLSVKAYGSDDELLVGENLFSADKTAYSLQVPNSVEFVTIAATAQDYTPGGTGTKTLSTGINTFEIVVGQGSGANTYTITINRAAPLDKNALLESLSVDGYELSPSFNETTLNYTLTVDYEVQSVTVNATAKSPATLLTTLGAVSLNVGDNTVQIEVAAQDPAVPHNTYTIVITRSRKADTTNTFTATLKNSSGKDLLGQPSSDGNYAVRVNSNAGTLTLEVVATSDSAIAKINDVGEGQTATLQIAVGDLKPGVNLFNISITPAQGEERICKLTIQVESTSSVKPEKLITFKANGVDCEAVLNSTGIYVVDYPEGTTSMQFEVVIDHDSAVILMDDNKMFVEKKDAVPCDPTKVSYVVLTVDDQESFVIMLRPLSAQVGAPWIEFGNAADSKLQLIGITFQELSDEKTNVVVRSGSVSAASNSVSFKSNALPATTQITAVHPSGNFKIERQKVDDGLVWEFKIDDLAEGNNVIVYTITDDELLLNKTIVMEIWKPFTGNVEAKPEKIEFATIVIDGVNSVLKFTGDDDLTEESLKSLIITVTYEDGSVVTGKASDLGATVVANKDSKTIKATMDSATTVTAECNYEIVKGGSNVGLIVALVLFIVIAVGASLVMVLFILKWKKATTGENRSAGTEE